MEQAVSKGWRRKGVKIEFLKSTGGSASGG
jgi:hypothetical protein